jgi:hypothetical protein
MSCNSAIYTANNTTNVLAVNNVVPMGRIVRRFGKNINLNDNTFDVCGDGYYDVTANFTIAPAATGTVTVTALKDGAAIPGGVATVTTTSTGSTVTLPLSCLVRLQCCDSNSSISFVTSGSVSATFTNVSVVIKKV